MSQFDEDATEYKRLDRDDPQDATLDSEIDFDDETDDDQQPLDQVEAMEVGADLDDPERLSDE